MPSRPAPADRLSRASGLSDAEILGRIRRGDVQLFELLMRRHNQRLYRLVRSIVREDAAAEDAAQEAWVRAFTHLHQFEERSTFSTWLLRIGVHEAYASLRRARRLVPFEGARTTNTGQDAMDEGHVEDVVGRSLAADSPEWLAERAELRRILVRVIDRLPRPHRLVFVLRDVEGLSTAETAAALGISEQNVKVRLHRARASLREALERAVGAEVSQVFGFDGARCDALVDAVMARLDGREAQR
jgi:RNA polymerase sigma-70 factor (ECF subfamily)